MSLFYFGALKLFLSVDKADPFNLETIVLVNSFTVLLR